MSCSRPGDGPARSTDRTSLDRWRRLAEVMNRVLIAIGALVVILGLGWSWFRHVPLFRLPGDIVIDRPGFKFFLPITTMLLLSALVSLVAWVLRR